MMNGLLSMFPQRRFRESVFKAELIQRSTGLSKSMDRLVTAENDMIEDRLPLGCLFTNHIIDQYLRMIREINLITSEMC